MFVFSMFRFPIQLHTDVITCPFFKADRSTSVGVRIHDGLDRSLQGFAAKVGLTIDPSKRLIVLPRTDWTDVHGKSTHGIRGSVIDLNRFVTASKIHFFLYDTSQTEVSVALNTDHVEWVENVYRMKLEWPAASLFNFFTYFSFSGKRRGDGPWDAEDVAAVGPFELAKAYDRSAEFGYVHFHPKANAITITEARQVASELMTCVTPRAKGDMAITGI